MARQLRMLICIVASLIANTAKSQVASDVSRPTNLNLIVGSQAGGGYDLYARILARSLANHIEGQPRIIVQNMPGANGISALNHIFYIAARDGSVISAAANAIPLDPLLDGPASKFDPFQLNWIGSIDKQVNVCISWATRPFKTLDDAIKGEMILASTGPLGWRSLMPKILNNLAGTRFKIVLGYEPTGSQLAVENGEVDGTCTTYETLKATQADWLAQNRITFLAQFGRVPIPAIASVPSGLPYIKNEEDMKAVQLIFLQQEFGRPFVAPPKVPAARLKILRDAFDATMRDPSYIAEAERAGMSVNPMSGVELELALKQAYSASPDTIRRAKLILQEAGAK